MKPFPWRPGMRTTSGRRLSERGERSLPPLNAEPDRADSATLGAFLGAVREAWNDPYICAVPIERWTDDGSMWCVSGWIVRGIKRDHLGRGLTEFAALLAAWEAAP